MIHTSKQLKDKIRNISKGDNEIAKTLIRTFMMERFLERVSLSKYRNNFILKGGMLVASVVGVNMRATMDIDTTVKALPLNEKDAERIISEFCSVFPIPTRRHPIELPERIGKMLGRRVAQFVRYHSNAFVAFAQKQAGSRHAGFCSFLKKCFVVMLLQETFSLAFA